MKHLIRLLSCLVVMSMIAIGAHAQRYEIHTYAGGVFPGKLAGLIDVGNTSLAGVKSGIFLTDELEIEGNFGYMHNLSLKGTLESKRGYIWEGAASYHFTRTPKFFGIFGLGGVTTSVSKDSIDVWGSGIPTRDTFLSLSYGGGMKSLRRWGPVGYRAEIKGRTLPSFYGFRLTSLEATGGLTFSWGER